MQEQVPSEFVIKGDWEQGQIQCGTGSPPRRISQRTAEDVFLLEDPDKTKPRKLGDFFQMQKDTDDNNKGITNDIKP